MKFTLTITDATKEEILQFLGSAPGAVAITSATPAPATPGMNSPVMPMPAAPSDEDDDSGDDDSGTPVSDGTGLDGDGLPWDERIHASTKALTDKGVWRRRRGVSKETIAQVEAELRQNAQSAPQQITQPAPAMPQMPTPTQTVSMPAAPEQQQAPAPTMPQMPTQQPQAPTMPQMPTQPAPSAPPPVAPTPAPAQEAAPALDFMGFMQHVGGQMNKKDANGNPLCGPDYLAQITQEISTAFGKHLSAITDIQSDPNMINYAVQILQRDGRW